MAVCKLRNYSPRRKTRELAEVILNLVGKYEFPLTVRQVHYLLVETPSARHPNTPQGYQKVSRILTNMRYGGWLDWDKIVDETREVYKQKSYENIGEAVDEALRSYRRDRWRNSRYYVEVWVKKRTLVKQFYQTTNNADVHLATGGGFSSTSYVYEAVKRLYPQQERGKEIVVLYFGDLDPSGDYMSEEIKKRFSEWGINLNVRRVCLNPEHLEKFDLPKKFEVLVKRGGVVYNKIVADPRAKRFCKKHGEVYQVELEALDPSILGSMLLEELAKYVDLEEHFRCRRVEQQEVEEARKKLDMW